MHGNKLTCVLISNYYWGHATGACPEYMLRVYNGLLMSGRFPKQWKAARLVLIGKPQKNNQQESTYRPLCLLDAAGKLYEQLLAGRINVEIEDGGGLSPQQYGFRRGRSTVQAIDKILRIARAAHEQSPRERCIVVLLDVKNAFNTANWTEIIRELETKGVSCYLINIVKDYFTERVLHINKKDKREVNIGVPQGSVLGPLLWNVLYDGVMRIRLPAGVHVIGFADDLAVAATDSNIPILEGKLGRTMEKISEWLNSKGLRMAPEKTEAIDLRFRKWKKDISVRVEGIDVALSDRVRYLGVILDSTVSMGPHVREAAEKAERTANALMRLMPNIGGPGECRRNALCSVAHSVMLYGAPVWAKVMDVATYRKRLGSVQRKLALRVCRAYRTVSAEAVAVLAIHIMAREREESYSSDLQGEAARKAARRTAMDRWQAEWTSSTKGSWTRRLIPNVKPWIERKHGEMSFHLCQALSGHGVFQTYLWKIKKTNCEECLTCVDERDTPEHTLFTCPRWQVVREETNRRVGLIVTADNMVNKMLESEVNWRAITDMIDNIMSQKEEEERIRQGRA